MKPYAQYTKQERAAELTSLREALQRYEALHLNLNMARGKPSKAQLDMTSGLLTVLSDPSDCMDGGIDARNYGELSGLPSAKRLFAEILGTKPEESFGFELITIPMTPTGPDMDLVEEAVKDPAVKGMWCVPKYSNPDGIVYSDETVDRIAALRPAAPDFTLMWDNAYCIHEIYGEFVPFRDMLSLCRAQGNADMVYEFASTSKITFPGAGVACMAASEENMKYLLSLLTYQTISYDKVNQLRHVRYLQDKAHTLALMQKHAALLAPKFTAVLDALDREIAPLEIAHWTRPQGGYFISFYAMPGTAKRALALCKEAGVTMTGAGATYPYGGGTEAGNGDLLPVYPHRRAGEAGRGITYRGRKREYETQSPADPSSAADGDDLGRRVFRAERLLGIPRPFHDQCSAVFHCISGAASCVPAAQKGRRPARHRARQPAQRRGAVCRVQCTAVRVGGRRFGG